jgi:hypothetical protein
MMPRRTFLKWAATTLLGHVVVVEVLFSLPLSLMYLYMNYTDGTLTTGRAIWLILVGAVIGPVAAMFFWYTTSLPMIKRRGGKP